MNCRVRPTVFLLIGLAMAAVATASFVRMWKDEPLYPSPHLTKALKLSAYHTPLEGTAGDTDVFFFDSGVPGGTLLICGGTHPNEPAGLLAATMILENLNVTQGRVFVIPRANRAGFTHNDSQEAMLQRYSIQTPHGPRTFRNGSRFTNPVRQWPDPTVYMNPRGTYWDDMVAACPSCAAGNPGPGGQILGGSDSRNLNRVYPGKPDGTLTEQIGHAIVTLILKEHVDLAMDFHEASPEYPTINVIVAHQRAQGLASWAELTLTDDGVQIACDASSLRLRGLSHREWGDAAPNVLPVLFESANPAQGRLKGRTTEDQIVKGIDATYTRAGMIEKGLNEKLARQAEEKKAQGKAVTERSRRILYAEIPAEGVPIEVRVGRHVTAARRIVEAYNDEHADKPIGIDGLPEYADLVQKGVGAYLHGPRGEAPQQ